MNGLKVVTLVVRVVEPGTLTLPIGLMVAVSVWLPVPVDPSVRGAPSTRRNSHKLLQPRIRFPIDINVSQSGESQVVYLHTTLKIVTVEY